VPPHRPREIHDHVDSRGPTRVLPPKASVAASEAANQPSDRGLVDPARFDRRAEAPDARAPGHRAQRLRDHHPSPPFARFDALDRTGGCSRVAHRSSTGRSSDTRRGRCSRSPSNAMAYHGGCSAVQSDRRNLIGRSTHLRNQWMEIGVGGCMMSSAAFAKFAEITHVRLWTTDTGSG
jgi:hypothetical protein